MLNLNNMVSRVIDRVIQEGFEYEPSEIILALYEDTSFKEKKTFKKQHTPNDTSKNMALFSENSYLTRLNTKG